MIHGIVHSIPHFMIHGMVVLETHILVMDIVAGDGETLTTTDITMDFIMGSTITTIIATTEEMLWLGQEAAHGAGLFPIAQEVQLPEAVFKV